MTAVIKDWLIRRDDGVFEVDCDVIYPRIFKAMADLGKTFDPVTAIGAEALLVEVASLNIMALDQFWLEVIYQVTKLEAQRILFHSELDTRRKAPLVFHFRTKNKAHWHHAGKRPGRGIAAATQGLQARAIFEELRGGIPR